MIKSLFSDDSFLKILVLENKIIQNSEEEKKFRSLFEGMADAVFIVDFKSKRLIDCNKRAEKLTGYSRKEILSMRTDHLQPKDLIKKTMDDFAKHMSGETQVIETEILTKNKKRIPVSINSSIIKINSKSCILGIFRDITERKQREEVLKNSEKRYKYLLDNINEIALVVSLTGEIIFANQRACDLGGYEKKELEGKNMVKFLSKDSIFMAINGVKNEFLGRHKDSTTVGIKRKDGEVRRVNFVSQKENFIKENGKTVGLLLAGQDITDKLKADKELLESKIKLQVLYDSSSDAIMLLDEKGFFDCNDATLRLFGCATKEDFCSRNPSDFSPPTQPDGTDSMNYTKNNIKLALKEGCARFEHLHQRLDGTNFPAQVLLDKIVLGGKEVLQARVFDITKNKKTEEEIKKRVVELETINSVTVGREIKMIELKKEVNELRKLLGKKKKYNNKDLNV